MGYDILCENFLVTLCCIFHLLQSIIETDLNEFKQVTAMFIYYNSKLGDFITIFNLGIFSTFFIKFL